MVGNISRSGRIHLALLVVALTGAGVLHIVHAQTQEGVPHMYPQAVIDFHEPDPPGKEWPLSKMGGGLAQLYHARQMHKASGGKPSRISKDPLLPAQNGYVTIDAIADRDAAALLQELKQLGLKNGARAGRVVSGRLPIAAIPEAAALTDLRFARPARAMTFTGSTTSQGDLATSASLARGQLSLDGSGVTVGVMSDSYDNLGGASTGISSSDLPGTGNQEGRMTPVNVVKDSTGGKTNDEGRVMLEIIHDLAPGAKLAFHTALGGQASMVQGIRDLADAGADIIVDDVLYFAEPMFQDGIIAQVIDSVKSEGVAYFSAAGNFADQSWETGMSGFESSASTGPSGGDLHDFDTGSSDDPYQTMEVTVNQDDSLTIIFNWSEPYASASGGSGAGSGSDIDIFIADMNGTVLRQTVDDNTGGDPIEILDFYNDGSYDTDGDGNDGDTQFQFGIELVSGGAPDKMKYVFVGNGGPQEYQTNSATLYGHANARGAEAVAAVSFSGANGPRDYTALGGTPILFYNDGTPRQQDASRQKPGIAAPDCVNNTFFGRDDLIVNDSDSDPNFCGTSAAAPHAAAVAALMLENRPGLNVDQLYGELRSTAQDVGIGGVDDFTGAGLIQADQAALPVELVAFDAVTDGRDIVLTWQTATETNNAGFRVEKRQAQGAFERVAFVPGAGTTTETQTYQHRLADLAPGTYAFRLQQVDTDGTVHPSPVVEATLALEDAYQLSTVYPNPVQTTAALELLVREPQTVRAVVYDAIGRQVQVLHDGPVAPHEPVPLTLGADKLPSGLYLIHIHGEAFSATRRATVVR